MKATDGSRNPAKAASAENIHAYANTCSAMTNLLSAYPSNIELSRYIKYNIKLTSKSTVLPAKSVSDNMFCLQSYQVLRIGKSLM